MRAKRKRPPIEDVALRLLDWCLDQRSKNPSGSPSAEKHAFQAEIAGVLCRAALDTDPAPLELAADRSIMFSAALSCLDTIRDPVHETMVRELERDPQVQANPSLLFRVRLTLLCYGGTRERALREVLDMALPKEHLAMRDELLHAVLINDPLVRVPDSYRRLLASRVLECQVVTATKRNLAELRCIARTVLRDTPL